VTIASPTSIGRFRILKQLGKGGMGEVYLAEDTNLRRQVAIKVLSPDCASNPSMQARFIREGIAASTLKHPNVGVVYEAGRTEDGTAFICMEYVEGQTLRGRLARQPLPIPEVIRMAMEAADALDEAHRRDVVHRASRMRAIVSIDDPARNGFLPVIIS